jgi:hypothetical protein
MFRSYDHLQAEIYLSGITLVTTDPLLLGRAALKMLCYYYYYSYHHYPHHWLQEIKKSVFELFTS